MKIELDAEHRYTLEGQRVPGVNEPLVGLGLIDTQWFTEESRFRGSAVHAAVQYWLEDDLKWETLSPGLLGYVRAAIRFIEELGMHVQHVEHLVGSKRYGFCGRLDVSGQVRGESTITDWKSGDVPEITGLALGGYEIALDEMEPMPPGRRRRLGVALHPDGTYKLHEFTRSRDSLRFLAALDLYKAFLFKGGNGWTPRN